MIDWGIVIPIAIITFVALVLAPIMVAGHESDEERKRE